MDHYLVYWKTFAEEVPNAQALYSAVHRWISDSKWLYDAVKKGDTIWVVARAGEAQSYRWGLVQQLVECAQPRLNPKSTVSEGQYLFEFDKRLSRRFNPASHDDIQPLLRQLHFQTDKPINLTDELIGEALQHPRKLSPSDAIVMQSFAAALNDLAPNDLFFPF